MARDDRPAVLATVAIATLLGILFWHSPVLYPLKLLAVTLHETGHALATYLVGGHVEAISISRYEGGVTHLRVPPSLWRQVVVSSAGYVGSTVFGALLLRLSARGKPVRARVVLYILGGGLLLLALLYFRDLFSWAFAAGTSAVLLVVARFAPDLVVRPLAIGISTFSCLYALFDLRDDLWHLPWDAHRGLTDADALAKILPLPALFWAVLWSALAVLVVIWALRGLLRRR